MHDKLKLLLEQLNINPENYTYFNDGNLRININTQTKIHTFTIEIEKPLPLNIYIDFEQKLLKRFKDYNIKLNINATEVNNEYIRN